MNEGKSRVLVWDISIRVFHWLFAATISAALVLSLAAGEHSPLFAWHMLLGLYAGFLLIIRILLGVIGSRYTRLTSLLRSPVEAARYLKDGLSGKANRYVGHNPLASLSYLAMFLLLGLVILTGLNMSNEFAEESHEVFAYGLLVTIALHLAGIAYHTLRFRENVSLSMVTGRKEGAAGEGIPSSRPYLGLATLAACLLFMAGLVSNFDSASNTVIVPGIGATVDLGEEGHERHGPRSRDHDDHEDDD